MKISHKLLLHPRPRQARWLVEQAGYERWAYNQMLVAYQQGKANGIYWDVQTLDKDLRANKPDWTKDRWANGLTMARENLGAAFSAWANTPKHLSLIHI